MVRQSPIIGSALASAAFHAGILAAAVYLLDHTVSGHAALEIELVGKGRTVAETAYAQAADPAAATDVARDDDSGMAAARRAVTAPPVMTVRAHRENRMQSPSQVEPAFEYATDRLESSNAKTEPEAQQPPLIATATAAAPNRDRPGQDSGSASESRAVLIAQLLHDAISANKRYPTLAIRRGLKGVSKVSFMLSPDGHVSDTRVTGSSRYGLLDRAALMAVNSIDPFSPAADYLDAPEAFEVNVVFSLH